MQQSRDKYFRQLENQGINPVGDNAQITNTRTNNQTTCTQRDKGVVNPFTVTCKKWDLVEIDKQKIKYFWVFGL